MIAQRTLDLSDLPVGNVSNQAPLWWGQLMLALIEASMFFILLAKAIAKKFFEKRIFQ